MDTGSNISIVRPDILDGEDHDLIKPVNSCLWTVTGEKGQLQLGIGSLLLPQELWVADLVFLAMTSYSPMTVLALTINGEEIPLKEQGATFEPTCYKVVLTYVYLLHQRH